MARPSDARRALVLQVLEATNRRLGTPASVNDVIAAAVTHGGPAAVLCRDNKHMAQAIGHDLYQLWVDGAVLCTGKRGHGHLYAAPGLLAGEVATTRPGETSQRKLVLGLIGRAVERLGRPVRLADIVEENAAAGEALSRDQLGRAFGSLVASGDVRVTGRVSGAGGGRLVVPAGVEVGGAVDNETLLTWNETVAAAFDRVWETHLQDATRTGTPPVPVAAEEIIAELKRNGGLTSNAGNSVSVALRLLARPRVRRVRRVGTGKASRARWAPADVPDHALDLHGATLSRAYPSRVSLLIRRAVSRLGVPAVSSHDLRTESANSPDAGLPASEIAKALVIACPRPKASANLKNPLVLRAGHVGHRPYYCLPESADAARRYVRWLQAEHAWKQVSWEKHLEAIGRYRLPAFAAAHLGHLAAQARTVREAALRALEDPAAGEAVRLGVHACLRDVEEAERACPALKRHDSEGPEETGPIREIPRWAPEQFREALSRVTDDPRTLGKIDPYIVRVPNPSFVSRAAKTREQSVRWHLDRTSALLHLAETHGDRMHKVMAELARPELVFIRDPQPAVDSLGLPDPDQRLVAVACLAFLWAPAAMPLLGSIAASDSEPGVREAASWVRSFRATPHTLSPHRS